MRCANSAAFPENRRGSKKHHAGAIGHSSWLLADANALGAREMVMVARMTSNQATVSNIAVAQPAYKPQARCNTNAKGQFSRIIDNWHGNLRERPSRAIICYKSHVSLAKKNMLGFLLFGWKNRFSTA
jgi:hypothetical protein